MFEFAVGVFIFAFIWLIGFLLREDLRKPMIWSGLVYATLLLTVHIMWLISKNFIDFGPNIVTGYWNPDTFFDLSRRTGGLGIEDILFMFFVGGISLYLYELIFKRKIKFKINYKHHIRVFIILLISFFIFGAIFKLALIYVLIISSFIGALVIWIERKDLIKQSLYGGMIFLIVYILGFFIFNIIFSDFIMQTYNLNNLLGLIYLGVPIEEYLYALSFGLLWTPIYEYEHEAKDVKK